MIQQDYQTMIEYCEKITKSGKQLCICWDGGNDSGFFEMSIDGETIDDPDDLQNAIIKLVADNTDYGSFAGEFDVRGEVFYNPITKCFEGNDKYTESRNGVKKCSIEVRVPKEIWFDSININLDTDKTEIEKLSVSIIINDGVRTQQHDFVEVALQKTLMPQFMSEIESIKGISSAWNIITINYKDFSEEKSELVFQIKKFDYNFNFTINSEIIIDSIKPNRNEYI